MSKTSPTDMLSVSYYSPEPDREGHASFTHVHEIIEGLQRRNWSVVLFSPTYASRSLPGVVGRLRGIGGSITRCVVAGRCDLVYMRWHFAAFPIGLWAKLLRIPLFIEINGPSEDLYIAWPFTQRFRWLFEWMMQKQIEWAAGVITVTPGLEAMSRDRAPAGKPVMTIPNGANIEMFSPDSLFRSNDLTAGLPDKFMVFFGSMAPWQGIDTILAAAGHADWPKDVALVFAGDGQLRPVVEAAAGKHDHIFYIGRQPYAELPAVVARASGSFVSMEDTEGRAATGLAPLKLFESLSCGVPIIVTDLPFQADVVREGGCGIVVPPGDAEAIVHAVNQLTSDEPAARNMGARARQTAVLHHSWDARAGQTAKFLTQTLEPGL